jgi:hypothetical protein
MREEKILFILDKLGCLSRSQIQSILGIPSIRFANKILYNMRVYLNHTRLDEYVDEYVYYLNKKGRERIGSQNEFKKNSRIMHYLMRNDIYIYYHYPKDWSIERPATWKDNGKEHKLISDARFTYHGMIYFVEIDVQQQMMKNKKKIEQYASLFRVIQREKIGEPILLWYTVSSVRKEKLEQWCKEYGVPCEVLCKHDV